jgi:AcrR family transcriptional regulator
VTREQIVHGAIELADAEGWEAISMRRIATRLGVGTMTLYGYVADRDALRAYMLDEALGEVELPAAPSGDWRADLELLAREFRTLCQRHVWLPAVLGTSAFMEAPRVLPAIEFCLAALVPFGMDVQQAGEVLRLINNYVVGVTLREASESRTVGTRTATGYEPAVAAYLQQVMSTGRFPAFTRLARVILDGRDLHPDQSFEVGLGFMLDGVNAALDRVSADPLTQRQPPPRPKSGGDSPVAESGPTC